MARIYLLRGKLEIKTDCAQLWNGTLIGPHGSVLLSDRESTIVSYMMLRPGIRWTELLEVVWPHPDHEPGDAYNTLLVCGGFLNNKKLRGIGLRFNLNNNWHAGKWIERISNVD